MKSSMYDFVKLMFEYDIDIKPYVELKAVTYDEYKEITGVDYASQLDCFYFGKKPDEFKELCGKDYTA